MQHWFVSLTSMCILCKWRQFSYNFFHLVPSAFATTTTMAWVCKTWVDTTLPKMQKDTKCCCPFFSFYFAFTCHYVQEVRYQLPLANNWWHFLCVSLCVEMKLLFSETLAHNVEIMMQKKFRENILWCNFVWNTLVSRNFYEKMLADKFP